LDFYTEVFLGSSYLNVAVMEQRAFNVLYMGKINIHTAGTDTKRKQNVDPYFL
jgi:hypothetical protein